MKLHLIDFKIEKDKSVNKLCDASNNSTVISICIRLDSFEYDIYQMLLTQRQTFIKGNLISVNFFKHFHEKRINAEEK